MIFRTPTLFTSFTVESWTNTLMGITPRLSFLYSGSESSRVPLRPLICSIASTFAAFTSFNHQATLNITAYNTPSAASCIHRHPVFILLHSFNHSFDWEPPHHQPGHSGAFIRSSLVTTDHSTLFSFLPSERFLTHFERHIHSFPTYKFVILFFLVLFLLFLFPFFLSFKDLYIYYIISSTWSRKFFRASFILIFSSLSVIGLFDTFPDPGFLPVRYLRTVLDLRALHAPFSKGRTNNPFPRMI